jgi:hypothetical protein
MENKKWPTDLMLEITCWVKNGKWTNLDARAPKHFDVPAIKMHKMLGIAEA